MRRIDIFNHIRTKRYYDELRKHVGTMTEITRRSGAIPMMVDLDRRFEDAVLRGACWSRLGSAGFPHFLPRLQASSQGAQAAALGLLQRFLRGQRDLWLESGARVQPKFLRSGPRALRVRRAVRSRGRTHVYRRHHPVYRCSKSLGGAARETILQECVQAPGPSVRSEDSEQW